MSSFKKWLRVLAVAMSIALLPPRLVAQAGYADYKPDAEKIILKEEFEDNRNNWPLTENKSKIEDGVLVLTHGGNLKYASIKIGISLKEDFEIEFAIATEQRRVGIYFDNYRWWIMEDHTTDLKYNAESIFNRIKVDPPLNHKQFNKYTIRKIDGKLHYFINYKHVGSASTDFFKLLQKEFVIGFSYNMNVDYMRIAYLKKSDDDGMAMKNQENARKDPARAPDKTDGIKVTSQSKSSVEIKQGGKYFGLIIGVSNYDNAKLDLDKPVKDAEKLKATLTKKYSFTDSTIFLVLNPTRQKILNELYQLRKIVGPNDNLLIFYAGHGFWDEEARQGYWWPKDAGPNDPSNWLSNSDLREQIRGIKSAHTLLISDACFSGGIFKTRSGNITEASTDIQLLYKMPSRRAITSGTMTEVPDKSVFLEYLTKRLTENQSPFLSSQELFASLRKAVINNSSVVPQEGVIAETGDEGGDFIFILKEKKK